MARLARPPQRSPTTFGQSSTDNDSTIVREGAGGTVANRGLVGEMWMFMRERKKWWLLPVIIVMLLVGTLLIFAQGSALAPFIYTIF